VLPEFLRAGNEIGIVREGRAVVKKAAVFQVIGIEQTIPLPPLKKGGQQITENHMFF